MARTWSEIIRIKVIDEPAVPPEQFARVQTILKEVRFNHASSLPKEKLVHLCSTYGRCSRDGLPLYITTGSTRKGTGEHSYFYCCRSQHPGKKGDLHRCDNGWASKSKLDALMVAFCKNVITQPKLLSDLIAGSIRRNSEVVFPFPDQSNSGVIQKLERREKRLLEMCQSEAISITELKTERAKLRAEIRVLQLSNEQGRAQQPDRMTVSTFARLIVKAAIRFDRMVDAKEQKQILEQIFSEVFFHCKSRAEASITAFRFNPAFVALVSPLDPQFGQTVNLETPFRVDGTPEGFRKCKLCCQVLSLASFAGASCRCRSCLIAGSRERWKRHNVKKSSGK